MDRHSTRRRCRTCHSADSPHGEDGESRARSMPGPTLTTTLTTLTITTPATLATHAALTTLTKESPARCTLGLRSVGRTCVRIGRHARRPHAAEATPGVSTVFLQVSTLGMESRAVSGVNYNESV